MFKVYNITKTVRTFLYILLIIVLSYAVYAYTDLALHVFKSDKLIPIYSVERDDKKIAITFDAAWGNDDTKNILDILKKYKAKATFFLVGFWVDKYPKDVEEIYRNGHEIGSHSDKHLHMSRLTENEIIEDIKRCENKIQTIIGNRPIIFRPPYGDYNNRLIKTLNSLGYFVIQWDVDSLDWKDISPEEITKRVLSKAKNGSIVLFHNNAKNTKYALPAILEQLSKRGFQFVTVSELIYKDNYYIDHEGRQKLKK